MDRRVNQDQLRIRVLQALHRPGATVSRTIVDDPEDAARIIVGRSRHDLLDQTVKGFDTVVGLAAAKDSGMVDIQRGDVGPGSTPENIRAQPSSCYAADMREWGVCGGGLEYWSSRPPKLRIRHLSRACLPRYGRTDRECDRPCRQSWDRVGRSNCGDTRGE
jgi:hypothetical protein